MGAGVSCRSDKNQGIPLGCQDISENSMKEITINDEGDSILVAKYGGKLYGVGSRCPHYGAPLVNGVLINGKIRCPWHGACFNLKTGDIEECPGLEGLPTYKVKIKGRSISINSSKGKKVKQIGKPPATEPKVDTSKLCFVIIGSGAASITAAHTFRQEGFEGEIIMITRDQNYPYDRPKLSKKPGSDWEDLKLFDRTYYEEKSIQVQIDANVDRVNFKEKAVIIEGKEEEPIIYDKLLIATGVRPRKYSTMIPGEDLKGITTLYTIEDSKLIVTKSNNKRVVIVGSSFIGMELASSLRHNAKEIHIISRSRYPYAALGEATGKRIMDHVLKETRNVYIYQSDEVKKFEGNEEGEVTTVITLKKKVIPCDFVILAIGATPNTHWLEGSDIKLSERNGYIITNQALETTVKDVYAAGDVTKFPLKMALANDASIAHWQVAQTQGKYAALSMLGKPTDISNIVPFFWTTTCGLNLRYAGFGEYFDEEFIFGELEELIFCSVYTRAKKLVAVATVNCDQLMCEVKDSLYRIFMDTVEGRPSEDTTRFPHLDGYEFPKCVCKRFPNNPVRGIDLVDYD